GRDHNHDGLRLAFLDLAQRVEPRTVGQVDVEQHGRRAVRFEGGERARDRARLDGVVLPSAQRFVERPPDHRLIIDDQNLFFCHKGASHSVIRLLLSNCFAKSVMWVCQGESAPQMGVFPHAIGTFPQSLRNIPYNYSGLTSTATGLLSAAFAKTSSRTPSFKIAVVLAGSTSACSLSSRQNWFERNSESKVCFLFSSAVFSDFPLMTNL